MIEIVPGLAVRCAASKSTLLRFKEPWLDLATIVAPRLTIENSRGPVWSVENIIIFQWINSVVCIDGMGATVWIQQCHSVYVWTESYEGGGHNSSRERHLRGTASAAKRAS